MAADSEHLEGCALSGDGRRRWTARVGLPALVALPLLVLAAVALTRPWSPSTDQAYLVLGMHDVGGRHTPTLGAYSRYGWSHPGPLLLWVGAIGLRLSGPSGVLAVVATVTGLCMAAAVGAARTLGGRALAWLVAAGCLVVALNNGADLNIDPWNPYVAVMAVPACALTAWAGAYG